MNDDLAVYIHWPYCDFNVYKQRDDDDLVDAIIDDLKGWRNWLGTRNVSSIHYGGGTPSLMRPEDIARMNAAISKLWALNTDAEIAIEANPQDASKMHFQDLNEAGVNRLSLGVQTFDDSALKFLGRDHDSIRARKAVDIALQIFPSVSLDLIFGWFDQTQAQWEQDIHTALAAAPSHISAYQLTIEDGTAFGKAETRGDMRSVGEGDSAMFYDMARSAFMAAGYRHYEVSNFAKPGHRSRHNLAYWQGRDYVGVGPGAHGRLTVDGQRYGTTAKNRPEYYKSCVKTHEVGFEEKEKMSAKSWAEEYILMGLRIDDGVSLGRYQEIAGEPLPADRVEKLSLENLVRQDGDRLIATEQGRALLNWVTEQLLIP